MLWWRQRKEREQQALRDAENLLALFGSKAYSAALDRARHEEENDRDPRYWLRVRREIARRVGKQPGLDTATRYLELAADRCVMHIQQIAKTAITFVHCHFG